MSKTIGATVFALMNAVISPITDRREQKRRREEVKTIQLIQADFFNAYNTFNIQGKSSNDIDSINKEIEVLQSKIKNLRSTGFDNSEDVTTCNATIDRLQKRIAKIKTDDSQYQAFLYFSQKYPQYRFITRSQIEKLCEKWKLVYGIAPFYKGSIPEKNLKEIEICKISQEDKIYEAYTDSLTLSGGFLTYVDDRFLIKNTGFCDNNYRQFNELKNNYFDDKKYYTDGLNKHYKESPLEIIASIDHFHMNGAIGVENFRITYQRRKDDQDFRSIPDPIVLHPVFWKGNKHYLIITAWGDEASDPAIYNHNRN